MRFFYIDNTPFQWLAVAGLGAASLMAYGAVHDSINFEACGRFKLYASRNKEASAMNPNDISLDPIALLPLPEEDDTLIRRSDLPRYLPIAAQTAARWSCEGQGPRFIKVGRRLVAYRAGDLREWIQGQVRKNTIKT